jgi:inositol hexakisphosphate/diphosphoinositol-pentakisphosphate kinase
MANAAGLANASGLSKLSNSANWSAARAAEARAAALSGIKAMPEKPLVLLFQLVELMKVLVDQLREKCLEERVEAAPQHASAEKQQEASGVDKASDKAATGSDKAAGGLQPSNSARGISSSRYSSLASSPDDWRLDESKPCSGERLLLMFDRCVDKASTLGASGAQVDPRTVNPSNIFLNLPLCRFGVAIAVAPYTLNNPA